MKESKMGFLPKFVVATGTLVLAASLTGAQRSPTPSCDCSLIDKSISPPVYIDLLKVSADGASVFLRLVNNTSCGFEIEAKGGGAIAFPRKGAARIGNAAREQDGEMLAVNYLLQDTDFKKSPQHYFERGDTIYIASVSGGSSIVFSVPLGKVRRNNIMVPVRFDVGEISFRQEVYFFAHNLPSDLGKLQLRGHAASNKGMQRTRN